MNVYYVDRGKIETLMRRDINGKVIHYIKFGLLITHTHDWKDINLFYDLQYARGRFLNMDDWIMKIIGKKGIGIFRVLSLSNSLLKTVDEFKKKSISRNQLYDLIECGTCYYKRGKV